MAVEGVMFSVSTDAHHTSEFANDEWGMAQARKGGVPISRIVNSLPKSELMAWIGKKGSVSSR